MPALPLAPTRLERVPMSFEEFERLPEDVFAEYVDGCAVVSPPSDMDHQGVAGTLFVILRAALPDVLTLYEVGLRTVRDGHRVPDIAVFPEQEHAVWSEQVPLVVVEVSSPSTRTEDLFRKSTEYQAAGVQQYWLVDRIQRTLTVLGNNGAGWDVLLDLDASRPRGEIVVGEHGVVQLDTNVLFKGL